MKCVPGGLGRVFLIGTEAKVVWVEGIRRTSQAADPAIS